MDCYFASSGLPEDNDVGKTSVVAFHIPKIGIRFKAPFAAVNTDHSDLASLLALLEFIDSNQKYFSNKSYQIFGTNLRVVNFVNKRQDVPPQFEGLIGKTAEYRQKYSFSLAWVPPTRNAAMSDLIFD